MQITWIYSLQPFQCWQRVQVFALRGDCLSRVDFPSWFVVRMDIRTVKSTLSISKISPPKPHVRPILIGIYCIDLLVSHLNTSYLNILFSRTIFYLNELNWWCLVIFPLFRSFTVLTNQIALFINLAARISCLIPPILWNLLYYIIL